MRRQPLKRTLSVLAASLAVSACWAAGPPAPPMRIQQGHPFSLNVGASAQALGASLSVRFEGVAEDSRCPKGESCIRAGDATVRVVLQGTNGARHENLKLTAGATPAVPAGAHQLRLLRLDPHPISGRPIAPGDYIATFTLVPPTAAESDR